MSALSGSTRSPQPSSSGTTAAGAGSSAGISPIFTLSRTGCRSRRTVSRATWPGATPATRRWSSGTSLIGAPLSSTITSPGRTPAASAGPPFMTSATSTPSRSFTPKVPESSSVTSWIAIPSQPRTTRPPAMSWRITSFAWLIGIEKPMPCPAATIAVLIPITLPSRFRSGPPELPGLMDASVWMKFSYCVTPTRLRAVAEMMPTVTVRSRPNGLPIAIAHWPTRRWSESPSSATGSGPGASTLRTARSVFGSRPTTFAASFRPSERRTVTS